MASGAQAWRRVGAAVVKRKARPALRYMGGKWRDAPWIIEHFAPHKTYVEPFGGGASVLLRKSRSYGEVYNDLNGEVVNLFRVLRDETMASHLVEKLRLTPFARAEFDESYEHVLGPVESARRLIIRSFMGFGSAGVNCATTGFRASCTRSGTTPAHDWANYPDALLATIDRMRGVVVEQQDASAVMRRHDAADTLHYCDPPYMPATRSQKKGPQGLYHSYVHEMTVQDHEKLLATLCEMRGLVVLSGYHNALYDTALAGWERSEKASRADGARARIEVLWINPRAAEALGHRPLFAAA